MAAQDPSHLLSRDLLPHVHLLSTYRYPVQPNIEHTEAAKWLMEAPKIARNTAPFFWSYLDTPPPGTAYLTWQPLQLLGTDFASDGYVWLGAEVYYNVDMGNGVTLEMYQHDSGYRAGVDNTTTISRRRFRLVPAKSSPQAAVDPSLWITHYRYTDKKVPVQQALDQRSNNILQTRAYLHRFGQILRKEFMLSDRQNWPQLSFPTSGRHTMHGAAPGGRPSVPPNLAYPHQQQVTPSAPPAKRQRQNAPSAQHAQPPVMGAMPQGDNAYDDEEDTSRGDMFDQISPRELAITRFQQNHEWMEEILSSSYPMSKIQFSDLGLGLKGDMGALTKDVFHAQGGDALQGVPTNPYVGKLPEGKADLFRQRIEEHIASEQAEMDRMKAEHDEILATFKANSLITTAEKDLRYAVDDTGSEKWRLEGRSEGGEDESSSPKAKIPKSNKKMEDIVASVENALGRHAQVVSDVKRVQDGGYFEPAVVQAMSRQASQAASQHSGLVIGDSDIEMGGTAGSLLDQINPGGSRTSTPNNFPTPQPPLSAIPSAVGTPANMPSPHLGPPGSELATVQEGSASRISPPTAPDQGTGSGEWVVVPKGGTSQTGTPGPTSAPPAGMSAAVVTTAAAMAAATKTASMAGTPVDDFSSLADLDTAGDVMATLNNPDVGAGGLDIEMEDSNFGDAFHGMDA